MVQQRVYDFGALLTQSRAKSLAAKLFGAGIYEGIDPVIVSPTLVQLTAGAFLLPNGVLVTEDGAVDLTPPTPSVATDYTLTADHDDIQAVGGSPISYTWRTGLLARSGAPNANSLAILWLRHPGAASIAASMISTPAKIENGQLFSTYETEIGWLGAPFARACNILAGSNITAVAQAHTSGAQHLGLQISNSAASGLQTYQFRLPLPPVPRARFIDVYAVLPNLGSIAFDTGIYTCVAGDGTAVTPTPNVFNGPLTGLTAPIGTISLSSTASAPATLGVTVTVPALSTGVFLKGFRVRSD